MAKNCSTDTFFYHIFQPSTSIYNIAPLELLLPIGNSKGTISISETLQRSLRRIALERRTGDGEKEWTRVALERQLG